MAAASLAAIVCLLLLPGSPAGSPSEEAEPPEVTECELTTSRTLTVIKSAGFPGRYGSNVDCRYTVRRRAADVCSVTFLFNVMDVEQSDNCSKDYLELQGERMCGSKPIGFSKTVTFAEDEVTMTFHSDNETRGLGYMVTVVQQDCPLPGCDATCDGTDCVISSPNFPLPYDNGRTCRYTVRRSEPSTCKLLLKVRAFDLEDDVHCAADFLRVGTDKLCGVLTAGQMVEAPFPNDTLVLEFQSDHVTTRDGFQMDVYQLPCDLPPATASATEPTSTTAEPQNATDKI